MANRRSSRAASPPANGWSPTASTSYSRARRSWRAVRETGVRRREPLEPVPALHPPPRRDVAPDGRPAPGRSGRVQAAPGFRAPAGGLSDDQVVTFYPGAGRLAEPGPNAGLTGCGCTAVSSTVPGGVVVGDDGSLVRGGRVQGTAQVHATSRREVPKQDGDPSDVGKALCGTRATPGADGLVQPAVRGLRPRGNRSGPMRRLIHRDPVTTTTRPGPSASTAAATVSSASARASARLSVPRGGTSRVLAAPPPLTGTTIHQSTADGPLPIHSSGLSLGHARHRSTQGARQARMTRTARTTGGPWLAPTARSCHWRTGSSPGGCTR